MTKIRTLAPLLLTLLLAAPSGAGEAPPAAAPAPAAEAATPAEDPDRVKVREILTKLQASAKNLKDYTMTMHKQELFGKELTEMDIVEFKWQRPQKVYLNFVGGPHKGREVLFVQGKNDNEVKAHEGGFLGAITVNLDPYGSMSMKGNHHPATEASLVNFVKVLTYNLTLADKRNEGAAKVIEGEKLWGWDVVKIEMTAPKGGKFYTMKEGETLFDVAKRNHTSMYQILHHNPKSGWDEADDPDEGDKVFIPRYYAGKFNLWIDTEVWLPIKSEVYDHFGRLYENFEHKNLKVNPGLTAKDFDPKNKDYDF